MEKINWFRKNKQSFTGSMILFFVVVFIMISVGKFYFIVKMEQINASDAILTSLAQRNCSATKIFFEGQQSTLKAVSLALEERGDLTSREVLLFLNNLAKKLGYERLAIDFLDGRSYTSDGHIFDVTSMETVERVKNGESFISDIKFALADETPIVGLFSPIHKDGKPIASLRAAIKTEIITKQIGENFIDKNEYFHLIDGNGNYVADSSSKNALLMDKNFFDAIKILTYEKNYSHDKFLNDIKSKKAGNTKYSFDDKNRYAHYTPVGINDWIMMTVVPKEVVEDLISRSMMTTVTLLSKILLAFAIIFGYLFFVQRHARISALLDEKCFRVLSEQTGNIIFEWDFNKKKITSMSNFENIFGRAAYTNISEKDAILAKAIHPDDIDVFSQVFHDIIRGKNIKDVKFRIKNASGDFIWCIISGVVINDSKNKPYKAIGSMKSIDEEEKEAQCLREKAQKDLFTDLYNKISTEALVTEYTELNIKTNAHGALLMIDLDNFKGVNDYLGHQFGDTVLVNVANKLKKIFDTSDIIGRVGGDEFVVFIKDILDINIVEESARNICTMLTQIFSGDQMEYKISASVGIAMYPQHGDTFSTLYRLADLALYEAKRNGKNTYMFYNSSITDEEKHITKPIENVERFITNHFAGDYIHGIFEMLYETKDIYTTMNMILGIIGNRFNVDRCYIFEVSDDGTSLSNTYEWCVNGVAAEIDSLQNIPIEKMREFFSNYSKDGLFYCNDLTNLDSFSFENLSRQGIKSMLHYAIFDKNEMKGFIGFDECKRNRVWSGEEIANLEYVSRILSTFILKKQTTKELLDVNRNYTEMLDNMDGYIYVVNPDTFETLYVNSAIKEFNAKVGQKCHEIAFLSDTPCENCPIKKLNERTNFATEEIYAMSAKRWVSCVVSRLKWTGDINAVLVCCTGTKKYKKEDLGDN